MKIKKTRNTALINIELYALLLVATPFLLVRNYLQQAIGMLSQWSFNIGSFNIPWLLFSLIIAILALLLINLKKIKAIHIFTLFLTIVLMAIGQSSTDYYFNHDFYELQHNWHYFAYGFFALISWFYHKSQNHTRIRFLWQTFFTAICISVFDESAQILISSRVFDICDIGKDVWGVVVGLIAILLLTRPKDEKIRLIHSNPLSNFRHVWSSIFLLTVFAFIFLSTASVLSESRFILSAVLWSVGLFIIALAVIYFLQFKLSRIIVIFIIAAILVTGIITIQKNKQNVIIQKAPGKISWRGITIPWFDIMIQTDGSLRIVDKKAYFNKKDKMNRIYGLCDNILLIGSGSKGQGGRGFPAKESHFVFNPVTKKPLQILVYPNVQACRIYNQLHSQGNKVLFIMHNS